MKAGDALHYFAGSFNNWNGAIWEQTGYLDRVLSLVPQEIVATEAAFVILVLLTEALDVEVAEEKFRKWQKHTK